MPNRLREDRPFRCRLMPRLVTRSPGRLLRGRALSTPPAAAEPLRPVPVGQFFDWFSD